MTEVTPELLDEIVRRLVDALHPLRIWLFGSQAEGKFHAHSDIDLMIVVADDGPDLRELTLRGYQALERLGVPKDLVLFRRADMEKWSSIKYSLPYEATRKGRMIYDAAVGTGAAVA